MPLGSVPGAFWEMLLKYVPSLSQKMWTAIDVQPPDDPHLSARFFQNSPHAGFNHTFARLRTPIWRVPPVIVRAGC
jgi:hypothetical protein